MAVKTGSCKKIRSTALHFVEADSDHSIVSVAITKDIEPQYASTASPSEQSSKSSKRKRAEDLLAAKYAHPAIGTTDDAQQKGRRCKRAKHVVVEACRSQHCASGSQGSARWCSVPVALPPCDWAGLVVHASVCEPVDEEGVSSTHSNSSSRSGKVAAPATLLPGGIAVHIVEAAEQLPGVLAALRGSMRDALIAIDLEWCPDFGAGRSRVALLQLASSSVVVLIRTCRLPRGPLPGPLLEFLRDPAILLAGFGWDGADEGKMRASFGLGRASFGAFVDLQRVASALGFCGYGLAGLVSRVLSLALPKPRSVIMSNWEARRLSQRQVSYAALDALVTGQLLRSLRLWHSSPAACAGCRSPIGAPIDARQTLRCAHASCSRTFATLEGLTQHARSAKHASSVGVCQACGRLTAQQQRT